MSTSTAVQKQADESKFSSSTVTMPQNDHHSDNDIGSSSQNIDLQIMLSRPYYRIGGKPVVGTILVRQPYEEHQQLLRDRITSLQFTMVGLCRYDPRWFNANKIQAEQNTDRSFNFGLPYDYELPPYTVPFWTSNATDEPIDLLNINERSFGRWDDVNPMKPILLPSTRQSASLTATNGSNNENHPQNAYSCNDSNETADRNSMDKRHPFLAYTFRAHVPQHCQDDVTEDQNTKQFKLSHSFHGASCRYYYLIVVRMQIKATPATNDSNTVVVWKQQLVTILPDFHHDDISIPPPSLSSSCMLLQIMAHSNGLPTRLTSIELNQWEGRYTVNRLGSALYRNISRSQSMRIVDPTSQRLVGILTIIGTPNDLHHGSRLTLKMDFPIRPPTEDGDDVALNVPKCISCYQVSACLQGQEVAIITSSKASSVAGCKRTTARQYVWDTAHEMIDPDTTECVALDLLVPETAPCSIQTPNVELNVQCIIDIAIGTPVKGRIDYRNIHLEIPCLVRPTIHDWERTNDDEDNASSSKQIQSSARQLFETAKQLHQMHKTTNGTIGTLEGNDSDRIDFEMSDIQTDLKLLSLQMAKICDLKPKHI